MFNKPAIKLEQVLKTTKNVLSANTIFNTRLREFLEKARHHADDACKNAWFDNNASAVMDAGNVVYAIYFIASGDAYVGKTTHPLSERISSHTSNDLNLVGHV